MINIPAAAVITARLLGALAVILTLIWVTGTNINAKYLGGLNSRELVFNWHPLMMVLGLCCFLTNGITAFRFSNSASHYNRKFMHVSWYLLAIIAVIVGLLAVFKSHERKPTANLYSIHSWIGLATLSMFGVNFLLGIISYLQPWWRIPESVKEAYKPIHILTGGLTVCFAFMALETGLLEKNTFLGCSYAVTTPDTNPSANYHLLPNGCKLSNGIGVVVLLCFTFIAISLGLPFLRARENDRVRNSYHTLPTTEREGSYEISSGGTASGGD
mmetsp:Transcript_16728/g.27962  ORF Transcript_16728/g.27962 Transcript_16728/m.27962 type:complete len:272 (-) Transcript_16728:323-1138(-)